MSNATERVRSYLDELSTRNTLDPEIIQNLRPEVLGEISLRVSDLHAILAALEAVEALAEEAMSEPAYLLPGGYPSKPVEARLILTVISEALQ